ncbi:MAG TPA: hypothetical protein VL334_03495 [Anaerolineae bacterium]|nr:hypothetical protein [Anaerolineae bacterium]
MKQYEAVIQTLERLGGQATLAELYREVMTLEDCEWKSKTPFASIRRVVQVRPEIFKVRPGLWALRSYEDKLGLVEHGTKHQPTQELLEQNHSYYQGLLVIIGNLRGLGTFVPNQDKNKRFVTTPLMDLRSLQELPLFSHPQLVKRSSTVDVTWFNVRQMPDSFFEVEHSTDVQNSLLKFYDLQDFHARMVIVADDKRRAEFEEKRLRGALDAIKDRVNFLGYDMLAKQYEFEMLKSTRGFAL